MSVSEKYTKKKSNWNNMSCPNGKLYWEIVYRSDVQRVIQKKNNETIIKII